MSTITLSPGLVSFLTDKIVANATATAEFDATPTYKHNLFSFNRRWERSGYGQFLSIFEYSVVQFKDISNNVLVSVSLGSFTRTQDGNGYIVFSGMPATFPTAAGEVAFLAFDGLRTDGPGFYQSNPVTTYAHAVTLVIDDTGSGADIELADRTIVTGQPWRMDGSFRFRIPSSYTYTL